MTLLPMPLVDDFLLQYNLGQVLLVLFGVAVLSILARFRSRKVLALGVLGYGLLFLLTPASLAPLHYKFLGLAMLVIGPMLYATSDN